MIKRKDKYNFINILVILITVSLFIVRYHTAYKLFDNYTLSAFLVLIGSVILVHFLKASRLYLALYGSNINGSSFVKTYCKVTPVSVILPFKLGELFRMYCYGQLIGNMLRGIIIILFDRFLDTAALITVIFLTCILSGGKPDLFVYILIFFLLLIFVIYYAYPGIKKFWTNYLLKSMATERKITALKFLDKVSDVYNEIENVAKGRGIILYLVSLIAWGTEICCLYILGKINFVSEINQDIFEYLKSALNSNPSEELKRFIVVTIFLLIAVYVVLKILEEIRKEE